MLLQVGVIVNADLWHPLHQTSPCELLEEILTCMNVNKFIFSSGFGLGMLLWEEKYYKKDLVQKKSFFFMFLHVSIVLLFLFKFPEFLENYLR